MRFRDGTAGKDGVGFDRRQVGKDDGAAAATPRRRAFTDADHLPQVIAGQFGAQDQDQDAMDTGAQVHGGGLACHLGQAGQSGTVPMNRAGRGPISEARLMLRLPIR